MRFRKIAASALLILAAVNQAMAMAGHPNANPNAPAPPAWAQWVPVLVMVAVFYILLIRPQMTQKKQRDTMIKNLKKGDRIVTQGGLICTITNPGDPILDVKINEETRAKIHRSFVSEVMTDTSDKPIEPQIVNP